MADKIIENNQVSMMGKIAAGFTFSHQVFGEGFYMTELLVKRLSDSEDRIPVMVSERLVDVTQDYIGEYVEIHGQFRSYNRHEEKHNRLVLSVFSRELKFVEEEDETVPVNNFICHNVVLLPCRAPVSESLPAVQTVNRLCFFSDPAYAPLYLVLFFIRLCTGILI